MFINSYQALNIIALKPYYTIPLQTPRVIHPIKCWNFIGGECKRAWWLSEYSPYPYSITVNKSIWLLFNNACFGNIFPICQWDLTYHLWIRQTCRIDSGIWWANLYGDWVCILKVISQNHRHKFWQMWKLTNQRCCWTIIWRKCY